MDAFTIKHSQLRSGIIAEDWAERLQKPEEQKVFSEIVFPHKVSPT